jgi:stage III sporulation protein AE
MRRVLICFAVIMIGITVFAPKAKAEGLSVFDSEIEALRDSLSDEVREKMDALGMEGDDLSAASVPNLTDLLTLLTEELAQAIRSPLSSCVIAIAMMALASLLEGCTFSLRHTDMKEILSVVTALLLTGTLASPIAGLITHAVSVIRAGAGVMLLYLPLMLGIMSFSGHAVSAGGYYTTILTASEAASQLSARFLTPMLNGYLAISVASSFGGRIRLHSICELLYSLIRWALIFVMSLYTAVLSLQSVMANAADTVAVRAARFTLSSFVPMVGGAISEAYRTISGSAELLRSGAGVFVITAMMVAFLPIIVRIVLWQAALKLSFCAAQMLGTESPAALLSSLSMTLSAMLAVTVSFGAVFIISTAALMQIGGAA